MKKRFIAVTEFTAIEFRGYQIISKRDDILLEELNLCV